MRRSVRMMAMSWGLVWLGSAGAAAPALASPGSMGNGPPPARVVDPSPSRPDPQEPILGVVIPNDSVDVSARFDSRLEQVDVEVGQSVHEGQVLARLDTRSLQQELATAEAALQGARAEEHAVSLALSEAYASKRPDFTPRALKLGVYSREELDRVSDEESAAATRSQAARAQTLQRQAQVARLKQHIEDATLVAPFDGVVVSRLVGPGTRLSAGQPVLRLLGRGEWRVRFAVTEEEAGEFQPGAPVELKALQGDLSLEGTVESIAPEVDAAARLLFATATFSHPPPREVSTGLLVHVLARPQQQPRGESTGDSVPTGVTP
ncbi:efflux RND transporter periplasmic adaptor subunit [Cystobacter fuscus]|uniref:efflux RND transporter periplasmic adaptor subunit n=1 Tax=Cystobacter fuscus TaxID=43 RepID=UPI002B2C6542|nr:efflux RND transporter periplasmic adaptor subunit [Cystobacter fuscus]